MLEHYYENNEYEDTKYIGVFSDKKKAHEALEMIKKRSGFNKSSDGFCISEICINKSSWSEGFTYYNPEDE